MIRIRHFQTGEAGPCITLFIEGTQSCKDFKQLVQNGANLWDQSPPEMKTLADLVTSGKEMQPYASLTTRNSIAPEASELI